MLYGYYRPGKPCTGLNHETIEPMCTVVHT